MTILAIDTSGEYLSLSLLESGERGEGKLTEAAFHTPDGQQAARLLGEIQALLRRAGVRLEDVDCFAAGAGPGSFTGVRVALSAAKGFAMALAKPMAAVSSLQALAWFGTRERRAVVTGARRGEIYAAVYNARLEAVEPEVVTTASEFVAHLTAAAGGDVEIITTDASLLLIAGAAPAFALREVKPADLAQAIAHIALAGSMQVDSALTDANYVRRTDAAMNWVDGR